MVSASAISEEERKMKKDERKQVLVIEPTPAYQRDIKTTFRAIDPRRKTYKVTIQDELGPIRAARSQGAIGAVQLLDGMGGLDLVMMPFFFENDLTAAMRHDGNSTEGYGDVLAALEKLPARHDYDHEPLQRLESVQTALWLKEHGYQGPVVLVGGHHNFTGAMRNIGRDVGELAVHQMQEWGDNAWLKQYVHWHSDDVKSDLLLHALEGAECPYIDVIHPATGVAKVVPHAKYTAGTQ